MVWELNMYNSSHQPYCIHTSYAVYVNGVHIYLVLVAFSESRWIVTNETEVFLWQCLVSEPHAISMLPTQTLLTLVMGVERGERGEGEVRG